MDELRGGGRGTYHGWGGGSKTVFAEGSYGVFPSPKFSTPFVDF